ncbi:transcriptional regulator [Vagococcus coleopterorum]|uniref:Transcriptional regulator n=1 Tax=Vagococcus coleopterorum TaxID=2714946 RepID=A0A6G8APU5_9ENTE|nr:LCP family protein [Vagococcus coleopterorum]QIL46962.1 transcriptional regulator [Vagococcus coleopterorum]
MLTLVGIVAVGAVAAGGFGGKVYMDLKGMAGSIQEKVERETSGKRNGKVDLNGKQSFTMLLLGIDTGDLGRVEQGRSDTMIVATVNPKEDKTTLTSIPRDTYTEIMGYNGNQKDKINHAYAYGGAGMSMDTVENLLNVPIDFYVSINMEGLKELVDAVGGVTLNNTLEFTQDGHYFPVGQITLGGEEALAYSRMRHEDPNGDYGRQERQRLVITSIVKSAMNVSTITNYKDILDSLSANMKTDLSWDQLLKIQKNYSSSLGNTIQDNLKGEGQMLNGVSYQVVSDEEVQRVSTAINNQLN